MEKKTKGICKKRRRRRRRRQRCSGTEMVTIFWRTTIAKIAEQRAPMTLKKASTFDSGNSSFDVSLISLEKRNKERWILLFPQNSSI
jgi:hypothetical protein